MVNKKIVSLGIEIGTVNLIKGSDPMKKLLSYGFAGERYKDKDSLSGIGLKILWCSLASVMGDFPKAIVPASLQK